MFIDKKKLGIIGGILLALFFYMLGSGSSDKAPVQTSPTTEDTYNPTNGTMLVINNTNPLVTHRVRAMADKSINRYTVSFNYKWK